MANGLKGVFKSIYLVLVIIVMYPVAFISVLTMCVLWQTVKIFLKWILPLSAIGMAGYWLGKHMGWI